MHYYKKNIGDYYKKAGRLTMLQHGAYTLLIDSCYDRERFPTLGEALDWTWASTEAEIEAVNFVLQRFFTLVDGVYTQHRVQEELDKYRHNAAINQRIAEEREAKRRKKSTKRERSVNEAPPNQEPLTKNQEPLPTGVDEKAWNEFIQHRKDIKKPLSELARTKNINILMAMSPEQQKRSVDKTIANRWSGLFPDKTNGANSNDEKPYGFGAI